LGGVLVQVDDHDRRAAADQRLGGAEADPARRAGDQRDPAAQVVAGHYVLASIWCTRPRYSCSSSTLSPAAMRSTPVSAAARRLGRRALPVLVLIAVAAAILAFAPGLGEVRDRFRGADPAWLALGVGLEALSCVSYVVLFRPVFCARMSWRTSWEISWAELGV